MLENKFSLVADPKGSTAIIQKLVIGHESTGTLPGSCLPEMSHPKERRVEQQHEAIFARNEGWMLLKTGECVETSMTFWWHAQGRS